MKQPAFRAEDGATFHGSVQQLGPRQFRASCTARLNLGSQSKEEEPEMKVFGSQAEAEAWLKDRAIRRGFSKLHYRS